MEGRKDNTDDRKKQQQETGMGRQTKDRLRSCQLTERMRTTLEHMGQGRMGTSHLQRSIHETKAPKQESFGQVLNVQKEFRKVFGQFGTYPLDGPQPNPRKEYTQKQGNTNMYMT